MKLQLSCVGLALMTGLSACNSPSNALYVQGSIEANVDGTRNPFTFEPERRIDQGTVSGVCTVERLGTSQNYGARFSLVNGAAGGATGADVLQSFEFEMTSPSAISLEVQTNGGAISGTCAAVWNVGNDGTAYAKIEACQISTNSRIAGINAELRLRGCAVR